jgi:serine/threonine protein kinase
MTPKNIGRFKVGRQLGSGNQGTVYLCADTELQRRVAIKLLDKSVAGGGYLSEARTMSKLQHPNIVSIYEAGDYKGIPYLVFEYVEGRLLADVVRQDRLDMAQNLKVFEGLLEGVAQAHQVGVVNRDLKPANIILNQAGVPKIMDFGIARILSGGREKDDELIGTPRYLAPEYISKGEVGPQNDVFALGLIMDEMLTGIPVFSGKSQKMVLESILKTTPRPPSEFNESVDQWLDQFLLKAMEKEPDIRYKDGGEMLQAFRELRKGSASDEVINAKAGHGTVEFLLRKMKRKSDFPVLSQSVRSINAMADASDKDVNHLASVIVKDFALTNKILKVVNSAYYGRFSGRIGTVSRAVVVLGIQPIRSLAASLIFFEHIRDKGQAGHLRELVSSAMFNATFALQVSKRGNKSVSEDYFLSAMLRDLGRILIAFYLTDEEREVEHLIEQERMEPAKAQHSVLGVTYEQIGMEIAQQWNFPKSLVESMQPWDTSDRPVTRNDKRRLVAEFSIQATKLIKEEGIANKSAVSALVARFEEDLGLEEDDFRAMAKEAFDEFHEMTKALTGDISQPLVRKLSDGIGRSNEETQRSIEETLAVTGEGLGETQILDSLETEDNITEVLDEQYPRMPKDAEAMLMEGLQEVTGMLVGECSVSEVFNVVLESMYRSLGFQRVVLALLNRQTGMMAGRLGFGDGVDEFVERFKFSVEYRVDVFHGVLKNAVDVYIRDTTQKKIQLDIPDWYKKISNAGSFLLFPIVIKNKPIGLIYADHPLPNGLEIDKKKLNLLKSLRNQIVLAVR